MILNPEVHKGGGKTNFGRNKILAKILSKRAQINPPEEIHVPDDRYYR